MNSTHKVVKNSLNPVWDPIDIPIRSLCNGEYERGLKFVVLDWNRGGSTRHKDIGEFATTLGGLVDDADKKEKIFLLAQPGNEVSENVPIIYSRGEGITRK